MDIKFKSLKLKNFLSFGNKESEYTFEDGKIVNVKGRNLDIEIGKENGSSNGSGKSTVFQAAVYCLYGRGINDIKQDEFINITNEKDMRVELNLEVENKHIQIVRTRKPNSVQLWVNGEDWTRDSIANTGELIQSLVRVNYETFILSFLMTTSVQPLLARKPSEQRNFMEELLGMNVLTERATRVKGIRDDLTVELKLVDKDIEHAHVLNDKEQIAFDTSKTRFENWNESTKSRIKELQSELKEFDEVIEIEDEIREVFGEYEETYRVKGDKTSDYNTAFKQKSNLSQKITDLEEVIRRDSSQAEIIESKLVDAQDELEAVEGRIEAPDKAKEKALSEKVEKAEQYIDLVEEKELADSNILLFKRTLESKYKESDKVEKELGHLKEGTCPYCSQEWSNEDQQAKIKKLEVQFESIAEAINDEQVNLDSEKADLAGIEKKIKATGMDETKAGAAIDDWDEYKNLKASLAADYKRAKATVSKFTKDLEVAKDQMKNIESHKANLKALRVELEKATVDLEEAEKARDDAEKAYRKALSVKEELPFSNMVEFEKYLSKADSAKDEYDRVSNEQNPHPDPASNPPVMVDAAALEAKKKTFEEEITHCKYLIKLLTDSKSFIRKNIIGRYVPYLNKMINTYADKLDSPHLCEIENDLTVSIEYMRKPVSYHSLSAGERLKLDVGVSIALRDLMTMIGVKSGFLMVDELFDSALDTQSKRNVFKLIKNRFDSVMLVSHSGEFDDRCDTKLVITKENGFSRMTSD